MPPDFDALESLFRHRLEAARKAALESEGRIPARQLTQLARLARLVQLTRAARPPAPRRRLHLVSVVAGTLVVVSALLFARVRETEIRLDLELDEVGFVVSDRQVLTDVVRLSALGAAGLSDVDIPEPSPGVAGLVDAATATAVRIAATPNDGTAGEISLAPVALPPSSHLNIERTSEPYGYRLTITASDISLRLGVQGHVEIALFGAPAVPLNYSTPRPIVLRGTDEPLDVDLQLKAGPASAFLPQLEVTQLRFARIEELADGDRSLARRVSTIRSGTLYLEELNGLAVPLRAAEPLNFEATRGEIRTLELRQDGLALTFRGMVSGMATGWGTNRRSLMPTYLEWLRERHGLYLLWGSTLYVVGIAMGILRWLGVRL